MNEAEVKVLIERVNNFLAGQLRIEGQLSLIVGLQLTLTEHGQQIKGLENAQTRLFDKSNELDVAMLELRTKEIQPIRDDMIGNRRGVRVLAWVGSAVIATAGALYSQWKPWNDDLARAKSARDEQLAKYQFDVGTELRRDDNRLTVLEFRANNTDQKASK